MISAVTAATPLYQDELAVIGLKFRRPEVTLLAGCRLGFPVPITGMTEPTFSVTFRELLSSDGFGMLLYMATEKQIGTKVTF
jgi:hypothetical protein